MSENTILNKINNIGKTVTSVGGKVAGAAGEFVRQKQKEIGKLVDPKRPEYRKIYLKPSRELTEIKTLYTQFEYLSLQLKCIEIEATIAIASDRDKLPEISERLNQVKEALEKI